MKTAALTRSEMIDAILRAAAVPDRARYRPVERCEIIGTDGKSYSGSLPWGVQMAGQGKAYWVLQSVREGTTHGQRHDTRESLVAAFEDNLSRRMASFRAELESMTDDRLQSQFDYWNP